VRQGGLEVADREVLTPICSAISYLAERHAGARVLLIGTAAVAERMAGAGIQLVEDGAADVVLVAHVDDMTLPQLEGAARAVLAGARLLTGNYAPAYASAGGPIISRGAMVAAAIAKASGRRPTVVGKPSLAAMREATRRLGVPSREIVVTGDDIGMDIALGKLGKSRTVLVRTGISAGADGIPRARRPDLVIESVADMLGIL
jgi:ribonucleotide monophosphatase NagD (HAD superfamily)